MKDNINRKIRNIIEALCLHSDADSIRVLEEMGTNSSDDEIRELTARALVRKNNHDSLAVTITNKGKGINDMSTVVAMSTINELLALDNKDEAIKILTDTVEMHSDEEVRENARSVKALMALS